MTQRQSEEGVFFGPVTEGTLTMRRRSHLFNQVAESTTDIRMPPMRHILLQSLALACSAVLPADNWTQFRGPNRDGAWHATGLLDAFPPEGPKVRWRQPVGISWATPVVFEGRVF